MANVDIQYLYKENNIKSVMINGYLLHSKYNPEKEVLNFLERGIQKDALNIIFGYGLGYSVGALKELQIDKEKILFIDPIEAFSKFNENNFDVIFTTDLKFINECIQKKVSYYSKNINIICAPNYDKIFPQLYKDILKEIKDIQNLNIIYFNTTHKLGTLWQENSLRNMLYIYESNSLNMLRKYYNKPVIVASGGPSLTKQLNLLLEIRESIILVAAGSTVGSLLEANIEPDYIVTIDGSEINFTRHFKDIKLTKASLIFSATSRFNIQKEFKRNKFAFVEPKENNYQKYINNLFNINLPTIQGGGSVANFSLSIARYISSGPIALIGQDLAYTGNKTHADNNKNAQIIDENYLKENDAFEVDGFFGDKVVTDYPFYSMKTSFEQIMLDIEGKDKIFNCTEGGVKIQGMQQLSFNQFIETFVNTKDTIELISLQTKNRDYNKYVNILRNELINYSKIVDQYKIALKALEKNRTKTFFTDATLTKLDNVDKKVEVLKSNVMMDRIIDPITLDIMTKYKATGEETALQKYKRVYQQNVDLYTRLLDATKTTMGYVQDSLEEAKESGGLL